MNEKNTIDTKIFKAYDIRGVYPHEINRDSAYQIGYALADFLKPKSIAIGRDMRLSSDDLFDGLSHGINDMGVDVVDLGLCSTDGLYFAVGKYGYDRGVMITASHTRAGEGHGCRFASSQLLFVRLQPLLPPSHWSHSGWYLNSQLPSFLH